MLILSLWQPVIFINLYEVSNYAQHTIFKTRWHSPSRLKYTYLIYIIMFLFLLS